MENLVANITSKRIRNWIGISIRYISSSSSSSYRTSVIGVLKRVNWYDFDCPKLQWLHATKPNGWGYGWTHGCSQSLRTSILLYKESDEGRSKQFGKRKQTSSEQYSKDPLSKFRIPKALRTKNSDVSNLTGIGFTLEFWFTLEKNLYRTVHGCQVFVVFSGRLCCFNIKLFLNT